MNKWLIGVILLLVSGLALASGSVPVVTAHFSDFKIPAADMSMRYLTEIFGYVNGSLDKIGDVQNVVGKVFLVLNYALVTLTGSWMVYTVLNLVFSTAAEGTFTGPQRKPVFVFLRLSFGLALLIPNPATGYSPIQDIVMKFATEGVKLADDTWSYALTYLQNGGVLYVTSAQKVTPYSQSRAVQSAFLGGDGPMAKILNSEVCMDLSSHYEQTQTNGAGTPAYHMVVGQVNGVDTTLNFPGVGNPSNWSAFNASGQMSYPQCGSYMPFSPNKKVDDTLAFAALQSMALELEPYAKSEADSIDGVNSNAPSDGGSVLFNGLNGYLSDVSPAVVDIHSDVGQIDSKQSYTSALFGLERNEGWFDAGGFYWELSQLISSGSSGSFKESAPIQSWHMMNQPHTVLSNAIGPQLNQAEARTGVDLQAATKKWSAYVLAHKLLSGESVQKATAGTDTYRSCKGGPLALAGLTAASGGNPILLAALIAADCGSPSGTTSVFGDPYSYRMTPTGVGNYIIQNLFTGVVIDQIASVANDVYTMEKTPSSDNGYAFYNPMAFVLHLGYDCLGAAGNIWYDGAINIAEWATLAGICTAVSPGATVLQSLMSWLTPLYMGSALALFVAGFMMCFYAPLYPFLLFMFGAMSWLLYVVEAMVAAPLVAWGVTHPEGHDFLGRSEQSIMLILSVFLRPVLMVIGFIVATAMSFVAFSVVNFGFSNALASVFHNFGASGGELTSMTALKTYAPVDTIWGLVTNSPTAPASSGQSNFFSGNDLTDFLIIPLLFVFYGMIVIEVVNQCFSLIHVLPDQILRWIGGPMQQDRTEQMVQKVGQQMQGAAKETGQIGGSSNLAAGQTAGSTVSSGVGVALDVAKLAGGGGG